jgi:hypothetical protein
MPESPLPIQGPASQCERDLDALLCGEARYPTVVLGPVTSVLGALRAPAAPGELEGEAAARAAFRLWMLPVAGVAGVAPVPASLHQVTAAAWDHPDGQGPAAGLPRTVPGGPRHRRPRRRALRPGRWQVMTTAAAAAVVIVGAVALGGSFSGSGGQPGQAGPRLTVAPAATEATSARPKSQVDGHASKAPAPTSTPQPAALCHQFMDFFTRPEPAANRSAENAVIEQLRKLAGGLPQITGYCLRQLGVEGPGSGQGHQGGAGVPGPGNQPGRGRPAETGISRLGRSGSASQPGGH